MHSTGDRDGEVRLRPAPAGYDLFRCLGRGGMGDVYLAHERAAERTVAMKFLQAARSSSSDRFETEIQALARFDHPNIIRVITVDLDRVDPFFTMEYAPGGTLTDHVKATGPMLPEDAARLIVTVARAVHLTHENEILHRDIKPSNVLIGVDGTPKLSDFGLAKRLDFDTDNYTITNGAIGTPQFMPPEQISRVHGEFCPATDVYGLGATLFYMLIGNPPFDGPSPDEVYKKVRHDPPPRLRSIRSDIPMALEAIVLKCLEKKAADRYASAEELALDLENYLTPGGRTQAPRMTHLRRLKLWVRWNRARIGVGICSSLVLLVLGWLALRPPPASSQSANQSEPTPDPLRLIQSELGADKQATLVGETGLPRTYDPAHSWNLLPSTLAVSPATEECPAFDAPQYTFLELLADPFVDRYRVTAEIRQLSGRPHDFEGRSTMSFVGLYFGHVGQPLLRGARADSALSIQFTDLQQSFPNGQLVNANTELSSWVFTQSQGGLPRGGGGWKKGIPFQPAERWPGPWRRVILEITPESIVAKWWDEAKSREVLIYKLSADEIHKLYADMTTQIQRMEPGANPGDQEWKPRLPLGIVAYKATVAFRKVSIRKLPEPRK